MYSIFLNFFMQFDFRFNENNNNIFFFSLYLGIYYIYDNCVMLRL